MPLMLPISPSGFYTFAVALASFYVIHRYLKYRKAASSLGSLPKFYTFFTPVSIAGNILPRIPLISPGNNVSWEKKHNMFVESGWDAYAYIGTYPNSKPHLFVADASAIKEITSSRPRFPKPVEFYGTLTFFGENIVASEGDLWKKHRKVAAPAFSERNNRLVWDETVNIMLQLFRTQWAGKDTVTIDHCVDITLPIALFVIGVAGFGRKISWEDDDVVPTGHTMSFKDALHIVSTDVFIKLVVPSWAMGLTPRLRRVRAAFEELETYMLEMIRLRRSEKKVDRYDLFSSLLDANDDEDMTQGESKMNDRELIGNIFIFLLAGHETTAHTLCYTFAMLALYPEQQEILYEHIMQIIPDGRLPAYEEMGAFTQSMAVFYETLRMFPPAMFIPKSPAEDIVLTTGNGQGDKLSFPVPAGSLINISTSGLHYNSRYWDDPYSFKPERFLKKDWPRDAFLPFSAGARACLGRRFFETEAIAILTMLVSGYKISVKEEPQFANETFEERKARVLNVKPGLTLTPVRVPLTFTRRK